MFEQKVEVSHCFAILLFQEPQPGSGESDSFSIVCLLWLLYLNVSGGIYFIVSKVEEKMLLNY